MHFHHAVRRGWHVFPRPKGGCKGFFILAPLLFEGRLPQPCAKRCSPSIQPLAPRAGRPDGYHTPLCAEGAGPYGNTAAPPTGIYCQWRHLLHAPRSFAALRMTVDGGALPSHQPLATSQGGCKGFIHTGGGAAHHNPRGLKRPRQTLEPSGRKPRQT